MRFSNSLIHWYLKNKRDLPWRNTINPYHIWLSEIILQQTRVAQGLPYYLSFIEAFPSVFDLANASEEQVLKLWQGLGYYSRARNLHATAKYVAHDLKGEFPSTYNDLLQLKGVGSYTAAAIASFVNNETVPVVDGNVYRVLSRYFNIETDISSSSAKKEFFNLAKTLIPIDKSSVFNQAIMEFGALQCVPKNPDCENCVFNDSCLAYKYNKVAQLPVKLKKTKVSNRYLNYMVVVDENGETIVEKRIKKGIWFNLYEFPLLEAVDVVDYESVVSFSKTLVTNPVESIKCLNTIPIIHKLSHQNLDITFWLVKVKGKLKNAIDIEEVKKLPFPIVIFNFILKYSNSFTKFS